jgi:hypothetical protein
VRPSRSRWRRDRAPDAAAVEARPIDAAIAEAPPPDAPPAPSVTDGMIAIAAGQHAIGEVKPDNADALKLATVQLPTYWIDGDEVTLGELREALKDPKAGGVAGDALALPARRVSWQQASDACKALGKRLPSEAEWEVAAKTAPNDAAKATLMRGGKAALVPATKTDCSAVGLCDMLGSVVEWTRDAAGANRIARGASYKVAPTAGWAASIRGRAPLPPSTLDEEVGFRCAYGDAPEAPPPQPEPPKPEPPKPQPPKPPEPPKATAGCERATLDGLRAEARAAMGRGQFGAAIVAAEKVIACKDDAVAMHTLAALAACRMNNASKAKQHLAGVPGTRQQLVRQTCARNGIEL